MKKPSFVIRAELHSPCSRAAPLLAALACLFTCELASAHPTPGSVAFIDFTVDGARIERNVPIEELERALHVQLMEKGESAERSVQRHALLLRNYVAAHVRASSLASQRAWSVSVASVTGRGKESDPRAVFRIELRAPKGEVADSLKLHDDVITHEISTHYTALYLRSDWSAGHVEQQPKLLGAMHAGRTTVQIARDGSFARGLRGVIALGMEHIASGTDPLVFLFALVLVAPLAAVGGRWAGRRGIRDTLLALVRVVSAFTLGHSLTLALGATGALVLPSVLVESAIAGSILITALHALRPLFPRHEGLIACAFGLVHGLGFASSLAQRDLGRAQALWTLLGFNVGIELAQLALLCLVMPWLLILARTRTYDAFRIAGAGLAGLLALAWLIERTLGVANPTTPVTAFMESHALWLLIALAGCALVARVAERWAGRAGATLRD
jgi:hypothetical protein